MKICTQCNIEKDETSFYKDKRRKDGIKAKCKSCCSIAEKQYYYKDGSKTTSRRMCLKNTQLKYLYGISLEEVNMMHKNQNGCCAICKSSIKTIGGSQNRIEIGCVDHNHATGKVRGLLCHSCNRALGLLKDSKEVLRNALNYLENSND